MYLQYLLSLFALHCWQFPSAQFRTASHTSLRTLNQFATQACFKGPSLPASRHSWLFNCLAKSQRHTERPSLHAPPPHRFSLPKTQPHFAALCYPFFLAPPPLPRAAATAVNRNASLIAAHNGGAEDGQRSSSGWAEERLGSQGKRSPCCA